jgi:hypothetical protein
MLESVLNLFYLQEVAKSSSVWTADDYRLTSVCSKDAFFCVRNMVLELLRAVQAK